MSAVLSKVILEKILLVLLGGLFGWMLGKMPITWVYAVIALAILLIVVVAL